MAKECEILFCDDIRREVGNKISLMGVYSPVALMNNSATHSVTVVCLLRAHPEEILTDLSVEIGIALDGGEEVRHELERLPEKAPSTESRARAFAALERAAPDLNPQVLMIGTMRLEALKYERVCQLKGYVNQEERRSVVFFREVAQAALSETTKVVRKKASSAKVGKKARPAKRKSSR